MGISTPDERKEFVKRLKRACEKNPNLPPEHMGRQSAIAASLGVVPEAVSRWFAGETMPNNARMRDLAKLLGVDVGWLALGHGDESPKVRDTATKRMNAATMFVRALLLMQGMTVADVPESDPNASVVSFYVVSDGELVPIIIIFGVPAEAKGTYETIVPANYEAGCVICVIPRALAPVMLMLSHAAIKRNKRSTGGGIALTIEDAGSGTYRMGTKLVTRIRNFSVIASNASNGVPV